MTSALSAVGTHLPPHADNGPGAGPDTEIARPRPRASATVLNLLETARRGLDEAADGTDPGTRYICAHLAALRAAAAIVAGSRRPPAPSA
jgi:HEPN superfamily protein